jgi:hypothetical protein
MKDVLIFASLALVLSGCATTTSSVTPPVVLPLTGAEIIYDEQGNYALLHFSAGLPVPDVAAENASLVMKPTWTSFEAFEVVP